MANEEEMEEFDVSERDLYEAFRPGQRRIHRMTKNQQIYGIFNDEEDDNTPSSSFGSGVSKNKNLKTNYSTPVGFVKGETQVGSKKEKASEKKPIPVSFASESEDENEGGQQMVDSDDERILKSLEAKSRGSGSTRVSANKSAQPPSAKMRQQAHERYSQEAKGSSGLGEWEKHTKGIGAKLLMQMGYQPGKGLGKALQGRSQPVEAAVRKGRGAIGLYGAEHKNEKEKPVLSDEEEEKVFKSKLAHWKRDVKLTESEGKQAKTQFIYRTSEDVIEEATRDGVHRMAREYSEISKAKVIDMTGPKQRVLSGYSVFGAKKTSEPTDTEIVDGINRNKFQLEKLAYNLETIVQFCEHEIIQNAKELASCQEQIEAMETEIKNIHAVTTKEGRQIGTFNALLNVLDQFEKKKQENALDPDFLLENLETIESRYPEEYVSFDLPGAALTYVTPLMKDRLAQFWRPFDSGTSDQSCRTTFCRWRPLLEFRTKHSITARGHGSSRASDLRRLDPYHDLLWHAWMPAFRGIIGPWKCKNANPMVKLLDDWEPVLVDWIMDNILDQLLLPKIQKEVDSWNPLTDLVPIHAWIHPWLPRLGSKLEVVYPIIRQKMAKALVGWTPSDKSALSVLLPWLQVFSKSAMDAFLVKNIVPKLQEAIVKWEINPTKQQLDVWQWIMDWKDLIPMQSVVTLLIDHFFPRWLHVLMTWLNHSPNYEEIVVWYTGWKSLFPSELSQHPSIQDQFTRALDLMNRSLATGAQVNMPPPPPVMPTLVVPPPVMMETAIPQDFRELVEFRCAQLGILCVPLVNRLQAGRPIYRIGNVLSYFDRQVVFVMVASGAWVPVTMQQLLEMAVA